MFAAMASSDSPRLKPRTPGPTSPSVGTNPLILNPFGSWERFEYMPFRITETAGFIALSLAGRLEACLAACSASVTRLSSCLICSRKVRSSSCVCAVAAWGRPSAAATASAMVAFLCMLSLQVLAIAMRRKALANTSASRERSGSQAAELGEDGRRARIEYDPRSERERKSGRRYCRQRDPGQVDRGRESREYAIDRVIRDALLGGMVDRRDTLAAALGLRHVVLHVRQRVQLRRLLRKDQRGGEKQVTKSAVRHVRRCRQHRTQVYYKVYSP